MNEKINKDRKDDSIRISFKKTAYEQKLRKDIISASSKMGKSAWIKILCAKELYDFGDADTANTKIHNCNSTLSDIDLDINTSSF